MLLINAGHHLKDSGFIHGSVHENKLNMQIRDEVKKLLPRATYVPDHLDLRQTIDFINQRVGMGDFAVDIHVNRHRDHNARGVEVYYYMNYEDAVVMSEAISDAMGIPNAGAKHDSYSAVGSLGFCRKLNCDAVVLECGYISNKEDREAIFFKKHIAKGIVRGLEKMERIEEIERLKKELSAWEKIVQLLNEQLQKYTG